MSEPNKSGNSPNNGRNQQIEKIDALNELAWKIQSEEADRTFDLAQEAFQLATSGIFAETPYTRGVVRSLVALAIANHTCHANYSLGLQQALQAITLSEEIGDETALQRAYYVLVVIHAGMGNYPKSMEYTILQLNLYEAMGDQQGVAATKMNLGVNYADLGQCEQALKHLNESLNLYKKLESENGIITCLNNIAFTHMINGAYEESISIMLTALELCPAGRNPSIRILLLTKLGVCYLAVAQADEAERYLAQAQNEVKDNPDRYLHIRVHQRSGKLHLHRREWAEAFAHLQKALDLATEGGHKQLQYETHELLTECYKARHQWEAALKHHELFAALREGVSSDRVHRQIQALEIMHRSETAVKEAEIYRLKNISLQEKVAERTQALEEQSRRLAQSLEREQHLAHELQESLVLETELSRLRSRIIEVVSHEFRTPLTIINTSADLLQRHYDRMSFEKRAVQFQRIRDAIFNLTDLLQDVTFINKADTDFLKPHYASITFYDLCAQLEQTVRQELGNPANLSFFYKDEATLVSMDMALLRQLIFNLIANAVQYSDAAAPINVHASLHSNWLRLTVDDQGIGIPPADQQLIFESFQRGSNVGARRGLGLGLSIVKRLCDTLGGRITVHSDGHNQGTTFTVHLPCDHNY